MVGKVSMKKTVLGVLVCLSLLSACSTEDAALPAQTEREAFLQAQVQLLQAQQHLLTLQTIQRQHDAALGSLRDSNLTTNCAVSNNCVVEIREFSQRE